MSDFLVREKWDSIICRRPGSQTHQSPRPLQGVGQPGDAHSPTPYLMSPQACGSTAWARFTVCIYNGPEVERMLTTGGKTECPTALEASALPVSSNGKKKSAQLRVSPSFVGRS